MTMAPVDDEVAAAAAVAAVGASAATVRRLLQGRSAGEAWALLREGRHPLDPTGRFRQRARSWSPARLVATCRAAGVEVLRLGDPGYPPRLVADVDPPAVLFVAGDPTAADGARQVAIVGTRSPTAVGTRIAAQLGGALADAGVHVVSGLAMGIDQAAHRGVLPGGREVAGRERPGGAVRAAPAAGRGRPVAVLGAAHDAAVGSEARSLQRAVADVGVVVSEVAPGTAGQRWQFAVRNRLMAALADVVVVVESHARGGSLHTVRAAERRGVPVAVVPGSPLTSASDGTNALLAAGRAHAVRGAEDVLALLGTPIGSDRLGHRAAGRGRPGAGPAGLTEEATRVLRVLGGQPMPLDEVADGCAMELGATAAVLHELAAHELAEDEHGWWRRR